jgi:hypothetical protein
VGRARTYEPGTGASDDVAVRADLPTGTVTFLLTDIEGSTRLLRGRRPIRADIPPPATPGPARDEGRAMTLEAAVDEALRG